MQLQQVAAGGAGALSEAEVKALTKRKLVAVRTWTAYRLARGPKFALERVKQATDLSTEMLRECVPAAAAASACGSHPRGRGRSPATIRSCASEALRATRLF